jgi:hypothetical protein
VGRFTQQDTTLARRMNIFDPYGDYQGASLLGGVHRDEEKGQFLVNDPLSLNLYTYTQNNPVFFVDPTGNTALAGALDPNVTTGLVALTPALAAAGPAGWVLLGVAGIVVIGGLIYLNIDKNTTTTGLSEQSLEKLYNIAVHQINKDGKTKKSNPPFSEKATVKEILKYKQGSIMRAPLPPGGPGWGVLLGMTLEAVKKLSHAGENYYQTVYKLLTDSRFNK